MCSSARWPSGSGMRWAAGSRGRVHRRPEGRSRRPLRGVLPGAGGARVVVLQVAARGCLTATVAGQPGTQARRHEPADDGFATSPGRISASGLRHHLEDPLKPGHTGPREYATDGYATVPVKPRSAAITWRARARAQPPHNTDPRRGM